MKWLPTEGDPSKYTLVLEEVDGDLGLLKFDIHILIHFTPSGLIRWTYLHHQPYQRPALGVPWATDKPERREILSDMFRGQLQARVYDEICSMLVHLEEDKRLPSSASLPAGLDRRKTLGLLFAGVMDRMVKPRGETGVIQAVTAIRRATRMTQRQFAAACYTSLATIVWLETGRRGGSAAPSTLRAIASMGWRHAEWNAAEYLESQAMVKDLEVSRKGGHR